MKRSKEPQVGMLPTRQGQVAKSGGKQDFRGQKPSSAGGSPGHPEQRPVKKSIPGEKHDAKPVVLSSDSKRPQGGNYEGGA